MKKKMIPVLVCIAEGSEEIETISVVDTLRRTNSMEVTVAKICNEEQDKKSLIITARSNSKIAADVFFDDIPTDKLHHYECIVLPGGLKGAQNFAKHINLLNLLKHFHKSPQKWIAAICASPYVVLQHIASIMKDHPHITCYPTFASELHALLKHEAKWSVEEMKSHRVCVDKHLITSQGPATAIDFALQIIEELISKEKRTEVASALLVLE